MKPYTDKEAGEELIRRGVIYTMTRLVDGELQLFILDHREVELKELHDEQELR